MSDPERVHDYWGPESRSAGSAVRFPDGQALAVAQTVSPITTASVRTSRTLTHYRGYPPDGSAPDSFAGPMARIVVKGEV